jgi:phenylalanyl-tRNA synthetase beta chain
LEGREVEVRRARAGERSTTLGGVDRILTEEMMVIADAARPVAIAGVMGGEESEVTADTRDIFLECALFDPGVTRRTRTALGLSTDASYRFERGVDPEGMEQAVRRALSLIVTVAGGELPEEVVDLYPAPEAERVVGVRPGQTSRLLGIPFTATEIVGELEPIGFQPIAADATATAVTGAGRGAAGEKVTAPNGDTLYFRIPGYRWYDVEREADLIEEVARRYGYDNFPADLRASRPSAVPGDPMALLEDRLRTFMVGCGLMEARLGSFVPESDGDVGPLNPLSSAETRLRRSLVSGLLREVEANFSRTVRTVRLFEIGTVFAPAEEPDGPPREETRLALVLTGAVRPVDWSGETPAVDLWDLKGLLTELRDELGAGLAVQPGVTAGTPIAAPTALQIISETGSVIGWGGEVESAALDAPAWAGAVFAAEVTLHPDFAAAKRPRFVPLPAYPAIERDAALLVPDTTPAGEIESMIRAAGGELLEEVFVFDLFRGRGIPSGARSIAYRLRFRARDRTLTDREADRALDLVLKRLKEELGVERRG